MRTMLNRRVGCEFEGYLTHNPRLFPIRNAEKKTDCSLRYTDWSISYPSGCWGIEVECHATNNVEHILETFEDINEKGWHKGVSAGTHIHVETNDFKIVDKARLMMFTTDIQDVAFLFVDEERYGNGYCHHNKPAWSDIFDRDKFPISEDAWQNAENEQAASLGNFLYHRKFWNVSSSNGVRPELWCEKYNWINVHTNYPTVEFRLFNQIETKHEILNFTNIAVGIVDLVKNSTVEQLKFIANEIRSESRVNGMAKKFLEAINIDWDIPIVSQLAMTRLLLLKQEENTLYA